MPRYGNTTDRGYGHKHQAEREAWRLAVEAGSVACWRCGQRILPGEPWDMGHGDYDRTRYEGPEHRRCNRSAGARKGNKQRGQRRGFTSDDRRW